MLVTASVCLYHMLVVVYEGAWRGHGLGGGGVVYRRGCGFTGCDKGIGAATCL